MSDQDELFDLVRRERFSRDQGAWDDLLACYTDDATVRTTWFNGTATDFVAGSRELFAIGLPAKHPTIPVRARIVGDRAVVESMGQILMRPRVHDLECDLTAWTRFFARAAREAGEWRIAAWEAIYVKDRLDPVDLRTLPPIDWDHAMALRPAYRFLTYTMTRGPKEYAVSPDLPGDDRPELVQHFYGEADEWLQSTAHSRVAPHTQPSRL